MNKEIIENYLWYGYNPISSNSDSWLYSFQKKEYNYSLEESKIIFDRCFDKMLNTIGVKGIQCVPLSGGIDSRFILGALRERLNSDEIVAYSFGNPGQLDYEVAKTICKKFNIKHYLIDLNNVDFGYKSLINSISFSSWTYLPDGYIQTLGYELANQIGVENIWSGFMGDPLTGGHYSSNESYNLVDFIKSQKRSKNLNVDTKMIFSLKDQKFDEYEKNGAIKFNEFLDYKIRQKNCISKIILGNTGWNSWSMQQKSYYKNIEIITPFLDDTWAGYWLNMPRELHYNQARYKELGLSKFEELFNIPFKYEYATNSSFLRACRKLVSSLSNRLHDFYPKLNCRQGVMDNYINYPIQMRKSKDWLNNLNYIVDFMGVNNIENSYHYKKIIFDHLKGKANYSEDILVLLGLVANLDYISKKDIDCEN